MEALLQSLAAKYGYDVAAKLLGIDKQTQNPKYAISLGNMTFNPVNMAKRGLLNTGIKNAVSGNLSGIMGPAALMGGALFLGQRYNPLNPKAVNYNRNLSKQVIDLRSRGMLNDRNQITSGPLAGKNLVSMFGTNDYQGMLDNKVDYFEDRIAKGKNYSAKNYAAAKKAQQEEAGIGITEVDGDFYTGSDAGFEVSKDTSSYQGPTGKDVHGGGGKDKDDGGEGGYGGFCFDPNTLVQMADGSEKKIKDIQLGDNTKGGEVTGVFQFKASDEIHDYKGVTVAGSHYVKEDGKFIMVQDSPLSVKIDKIPVVYSLDTTGRRIFIKNIEFADYNGDGVAKGFLANAGINVPEFNKEVLRQVAERLI